MTGQSLHLDRVNKIYGTGPGAVHAVRDFDLEVGAGEIVALLGSSGCGKTSTLRMIAGFEAVTSGSIRLGDTEVHQKKPARRGVAMAFEGYSLYPPLTVRENITVSLKSQGVGAAEIETRLAEIAALLEIENILDRYPAELSGGQQQRAGLGRALIREAGLHLLDEPMGQLEPQLRALLRGRIKHFIKERGLTAILVTHDQTEANALADRIAVMEDGELQQFGTPKELKESPTNLFTGTFIGEPPMNVFPAEMERENDEDIFHLGGEITLAFPSSRTVDVVRSRIEGNRVMLGMRPHAVRVTAGGTDATVYANQWLGDQTHIAAQYAGGTIVSVLHERTDLSKGSKIGISVAPEDLHFFDPGTGRAVPHGELGQ